MSTDKGFTAGFGGTFGVIAALVVIFLVLPCLGMVGCVGCAIITAGSARDTLRESARQAREAQEVQHEDPPADEDLPDSLELDPLEHQQHHQQDHEEGLIDDETPNSAEVQMPDRGPRHLADLIEESEAAVVRIETGTSTSRHLGSGFVVDTTGIVVTNYHVLEGARSIEVTFRDGSEAEVSGVLWADPKKDIAIIQLKEMPPGATTLPLTSEVPRRGTSVFAIGAPRGLGFTASEGIVSAIRESDEINVLFGAKVEGTWIQTTAPISSGNSGGPLIDEDGVVVGINTMTLVEGQNLNFAMFSGDVAEALGEARDAEPQPIASFDSGSRVAIQSRETIGLTIPAKRDFIHDYEIVDRYDEVDQRRTITVRGGDQYGVGLEVADGLYLRVIIPMPDDGPPSMAMFIFASSSRNWQYLRYRALRIVCDGQRLDLGEPRHDGDISRGGVTEMLISIVDLESLVKIANSQSVIGRLGSTDFHLRFKQREALLDALSRLPTGRSEGGLYIIDAEEEPRMPTIPPDVAVEMVEGDGVEMLPQYAQCRTCGGQGTVSSRCQYRNSHGYRCRRGAIQENRQQVVGTNPVTGQPLTQRTIVRNSCPRCRGNYLSQQTCSDCSGKGNVSVAPRYTTSSDPLEVIPRDSDGPGAIGASFMQLRVAFAESGSYFVFPESEIDFEEQTYYGSSLREDIELSLFGAADNLSSAVLRLGYRNNTADERTNHSEHIILFLRTIAPQKWEQVAEWVFYDYDRSRGPQRTGWSLSRALSRQGSVSNRFGTLDFELEIIQSEPHNIIQLRVSPASAESLAESRPKSRQWTSADGRTIEASLVSASRHSVFLLREDGQEVEVPLERLSDDDRQYVHDLMRRR